MRRLNYRYYSWPGTDWMSAFFFTRQELGKPANLAGVYDITAAAIYKGPVGSPTPLCWYLAEGLCHETSQWHFGSALGSCTAVWSQQHCIAHENGKRRKDFFFFLNLCELVSSCGALSMASIHSYNPKLRALWWLLAEVYSAACSTSTHVALSFQGLIMTMNS